MSSVYKWCGCVLHGNRIKSISLSSFRCCLSLRSRAIWMFSCTTDSRDKIAIQTYAFLIVVQRGLSIIWMLSVQMHRQCLSPIFQSFAQTSLSHAMTSMFCDELQLQWKQPVCNKSNHQCHDKSWFLWHCFAKKSQNESQQQNVQLDLHVVVRGLGYKINSSKHWFILYYQRVLLTLSALAFFSGLRIEEQENFVTA